MFAALIAIAIGPAIALATPAAGIAVTIGGNEATVLYAGNAPGLVEGVLQVNVTIPARVVPGTQVPVVLTAGRVKSQALLFVAVQ
jgi:uncharacterized protein (TIGR03437 family)